MANLRDVLLDTHARHGLLTPGIVLTEATPEDAPLHDRFDWNDTDAAHSWRMEQAHRLIQSVRVTYTPSSGGEPRSIRAFVNVPAGRGQPPYHPVEQVANDPALLPVVLAEMDREWKALRTRYGHLREFAALVDAYRADVA